VTVLDPQTLSRQAKKIQKRLRKLWQKALAEMSRLMDRLNAAAPSDNDPDSIGEGEHEDEGDVNLVIKGSAKNSVLFAAKAVHFHGGSMLAVAIPTTVLVMIVIFGIMIFSMRGNVTTPVKPSTPAFNKGVPYSLDLVVLPFKTDTATTCIDFAKQLSNNIAERIDKSIKTGAENELRSQSVLVWTPEQVMAGGNPPSGQLDEGTVAKYASDHAIDIVLYGTISCDSDQIVVDPEFYVGVDYFKHAPELLGSYKFGGFSAPIQSVTDSNMRGDIEGELVTRATAIARIGQGFEYYARANYDGFVHAAQIFQKIIDSGVMQDKRSQAVLHYMLGNAYLRASRDDCDGIIDDMLRKAEQNYQIAVEKEPEFASAYIGLGNIQSQWATNANFDETEAIQGYLTKAEEYYLAALNARISPASANVETRVALSRAQIKIIEHDSLAVEADNGDALLDTAETYLKSVVAKYASAGEKAASIRSTTAYAYYMLSRIAMTRDQNPIALDHLRNAALLASDPHLKTDIAMDIADLQKSNNDTCDVAKQYKQAVATSLCAADKVNFAMQAQDFQAYCKLQIDGTQPTLTPP